MKERTPEITHKIMSSIKQKDTEPELLLRKALWERGLRYRKNYKKLPGKPDIAFTRVKLAVFCDGDYWHGHNWALRGLNSLDEELNGYSGYWKEKILTNIARDKKNNDQLSEIGWTVLRFWESDIRQNLENCIKIVIDEYNRKNTLKKSYTKKSNITHNKEGRLAKHPNKAVNDKTVLTAIVVKQQIKSEGQ